RVLTREEPAFLAANPNASYFPVCQHGLRPAIQTMSTAFSTSPRPQNYSAPLRNVGWHCSTEHSTGLLQSPSKRWADLGVKICFPTLHHFRDHLHAAREHSSTPN